MEDIVSWVGRSRDFLSDKVVTEDIVSLVGRSRNSPSGEVAIEDTVLPARMEQIERPERQGP